MIRNEICNGEICFMAHGRDNRYRRLANCAGNFFLIESPEVFGRSTASTDDQYINKIINAAVTSRAFVILVNLPDSARDLRTSRVTLHFRR